MNGLSSTTRALLKAAKADAPQQAARAKIWMGVASTGGIGAAGVAAAAAGSATLPGMTGAVAGLSASKLLAIGALLGSAVTVGIAVAVLRVAPLPSPAPGIAGPGTEAVADRAPSVPWALPEPVAVPVTLSPGSPRTLASSPTTTPTAPKPSTHAHASRTSGEDPLMREAALVAEARGSFMRGDAAGALAAAKAAARVGTGALEPEELSVEARCLRALGREQEAAEAEARLRALFPEHALSR